MKQEISQYVKMTSNKEDVCLIDTWSSDSVVLVGQKEIERLHAFLGVWLKEYDDGKTDK